ncbi:MAG: nucleotidyltransferase family protein [Xanthomonadaceae bacterium]|jgi:hypothetical protein|nr:nucleotidyltransferase family protein [Xanthomonadaceae bacterium]
MPPAPAHGTPQPALAPALARWIARPDVAPPPDWREADLAVLAAHGLDGLAAAALEARPGLAPAPLVDALRRRRAALVAAELASRDVLDAALAALARAGLDPLLFKGEALARSHYPQPGTRVRGDADVWVAPSEFDAACRVLAAAGWTRVPAADGAWVQPERSFLAPVGNARIDLHRRLLSQPLLDRALDAEAIRSRAIRHAGIAMPAPADAVLVACAHLVGHHADAPRAIWWFDLHVLAADHEALDEACARALERGIAGIVGHALRASRTWFDTPLPDPLHDGLDAAGALEPSARLLRPMSPAMRLALDFATLPGWRARAAWLRELLAPDAEWLRQREGEGPRAWLLLRRALRGLARRR